MRMRYSRGGTVQIKNTTEPPTYHDDYLEAAHRAHREALARESWAPDRDRLRALAPQAPTLARLTKQMPAPRGGTPS